MYPKKLIFLLLMAVTILGMAGNIAFAQTANWNGSVSTDWDNGANWSTGVVPGPGTTVVITNMANKPVLSSSATVSNVQVGSWWPGPGVTNLTVASGGDLTITNSLTFISDGHLLIDGGDVHVTGNTFSQGGNTRYIEMTSGSFTADGNVTLNGGTQSQPAFSAGTGTAIFNGNLIISSSGSGKRFDAENGYVHVGGNFTVQSSAIFNLGNGTLVVDGNTTIYGTYNGDDGSSTFEGTSAVGSGGVINLDSGILNFNNSTSISGNGTANFGEGEVNFGNDVIVASSGYINVQDATVSIIGDADFSNNGNLTVDEGTINVGGNASITSGGAIELGNGNLNLEGDFSVTGGSSFQADSSTVTFSGDSTQTVTTGGNDIVFHNVVVDSGATFQTDGDTENTVIVEGNLTVNEGGSVQVEDDDKLDIQGDINGDGSDDIVSPAPFAISVIPQTLTSVVITFNKEMVENLAENTANYSIQRLSDMSAVTVSSATLNTGGNNRQVTLEVSTLVEDAEYELTINNLESTDGGHLSTNHIKRFTKFGPVTFYSRQNGHWATNSTWSTVSHTGSAANKNPSNTPNSSVIVGNGHTVTVASGATIINLNTVSVASGSKLLIGSGGAFQLGNKIITGAGTFEVNNGKIGIGSSEGISASGATGNIQTGVRIFGTNGSYVYNGGNEQITGTGLPTEVAELDIDNSNNVRATNNIEVSGTLGLTAGSLIIQSGKNLIANTKNIDSGDLIMEHTITGTAGWRLLSSPIASSYENLLDSIITQGYPDAYYSTGSEPGDTLQPNVLYYDETYPGTDNQRWRAPSSALTTIPEALGLYTFFFGDINTDPLYNGTFDFPITLTVQGQENEGDGSSIDFGITYTTEADSGWNLIGNPYAASIDWDNASAWTKTNIDNVIYVWDPAISSFKTWNGTTGDLDSQGLIAPFQGFWVKANDENPKLEVAENAKTFGGSYVGKQAEPIHGHPNISLKLSDGSYETSTHFMFSEDAKIGKDHADAYRLIPPPGINSYIDMSSISTGGTHFAINNMPRHFGKTIEIPIYIDAFEHGYSSSKALTLSIEELNSIPSGWQIHLIDNQSKAKINFSQESVYTFNHQGSQNVRAQNKSVNGRPKVTSNPSGSARFTLQISPGEDASDLPSDYKLEQNYPNPFNPSTKIQFDLPLQSFAQLTIYDILGREVTTLVRNELQAGTHTFSWDASRFSSGVYIYRLVTSEAVITKKMTLIK